MIGGYLMNEVKSKKIVVTGGAGYIGSVLCDLLVKKGISVIAIDNLWFGQNSPLALTHNPEYIFEYGSFSNLNILEKYKNNISLIIHTAAVVGEPASKKFPDITKKVNYEDTLKLIDFVEKNSLGFIFFSTCSNYGIVEGLATEDTPLNPLSLYAQTKVEIEKLLLNSSNLNFVICRLSTVYGISPRMRFDLTVNEFVAKAYFEKYIDIYYPHSYRPYIHVFDVANIVYQMICNFHIVKNQVFNIGFPSENYRKIDIANLVKRYIPDVKIEIVNEKGSDLRNYSVDFSKLHSFLNIRQIYNIDDGIKQIIEAFDKKIITDHRNNLYYNTNILK
jgi:nucleoside-diphosphate-sugar epimerase